MEILGNPNKVRMTEQEASQRVAAAERRVQNAKAEAESRIKDIEDAYESRRSELHLKDPTKSANPTRSATESEQKITNEQVKDIHRTYETARHKNEEKLSEGMKRIRLEMNEQLSQTHDKASETLRSISEDFANKLGAYRTRQEDPFYRMVDLRTQLEDQDDSYQVTASIPAHEQEHITVSVRGNDLVISGRRRNEVNLKLESGGKTGAASFQTFYESIPLSAPVDSKKILKQFVDDQIVITVPKLLKVDPKPASKNPDSPAKLIAEAPTVFSRNSLNEEGYTTSSDKIHPKPYTRKKGSNPLS